MDLRLNDLFLKVLVDIYWIALACAGHPWKSLGDRNAPFASITGLIALVDSVPRGQEIGCHL